jgi:hypothetical protein
MAINRTVTRRISSPMPLVAAVPSGRRHSQELEMTLPRTSRYRAHDDDFNETSGRLGAPSRHAVSDSETPEEWTW